MENQLIIPGIAPRKTTYKSSVEIKVVTIRETLEEGVILDDPEKTDSYWRRSIASAPWYEPDKEAFCVIMLNARRRVIAHHLVSLGFLDSVLVHPREVFRPAIAIAAAAILIGHNHPTGDPTPSEADIKVTRDLIRAGQLLKIELLDHIIIGQSIPGRQRGFVSLRELGYFYV